MSGLNDALRAGWRGTQSLAQPGVRCVVVAGGAGPLGSAVLERLLAGGGFERVAALVDKPLGVALRGFEAWPFHGLHAPQRPPTKAQRADTAVLVLDPAHAQGPGPAAAVPLRASRHDREAAFWRPRPADLAPLGAWLAEAGVRRLVVVAPHAPGTLPQALRGGLASLDEQALAALGFEQLVLVRPTRAGPGSVAPHARGLGHRVARALLSQLHWLVPQREQPLRAQRVAQFVADLAHALPAGAPGTRVVPPELLWDWAQPGGGEPLLAAWLQRVALPEVAAPAQRW